MNKKTCKDYSLNLITKIPKTTKQLKTKLLIKWYREEEIEETIKRLEQKWYINDLTFTKLYIQSEICKKGKPVFEIQRKLMEKWIPKLLITQTIRELDDDIDNGIFEKIRSDIEKMKKKWIDSFDIINKIYNKWYKINQIKKALNVKQ